MIPNVGVYDRMVIIHGFILEATRLLERAFAAEEVDDADIRAVTTVISKASEWLPEPSQGGSSK